MRCSRCLSDFERTSNRQRFCSRRCREIDGGFFPAIKVTQLSLFVQSLDLPNGEIATRAGISRRTVERITRGHLTRVNFSTADALVTAFDGDPSLLEVS